MEKPRAIIFRVGLLCQQLECDCKIFDGKSFQVTTKEIIPRHEECDCYIIPDPKGAIAKSIQRHYKSEFMKKYNYK